MPLMICARKLFAFYIATFIPIIIAKVNSSGPSCIYLLLTFLELFSTLAKNNFDQKQLWTIKLMVWTKVLEIDKNPALIERLS